MFLLGDHGQFGRLELVRDRLYWTPEYGEERGYHLDLSTQTIADSWNVIIEPIPDHAFLNGRHPA